MDNNQFIELITTELKEARRKPLPNSGNGALYDSPKIRILLECEVAIGVNSVVCEGSININYGIELYFQGFMNVKNAERVNAVTKAYLNENTTKRGYIRISEGNTALYELLTDDLEKVTAVPLNNLVLFWQPSGTEIKLPDVTGKRLEEAVPDLFQALYSISKSLSIS